MVVGEPVGEGARGGEREGRQLCCVRDFLRYGGLRRFHPVIPKRAKSTPPAPSSRARSLRSRPAQLAEKSVAPAWSTLARAPVRPTTKLSGPTRPSDLRLYQKPPRHSGIPYRAWRGGQHAAAFARQRPLLHRRGDIA